MFSCEFCKISKNIFFTERLWTTASDDDRFMLCHSFCSLSSINHHASKKTFIIFLHRKLKEIVDICPCSKIQQRWITLYKNAKATVAKIVQKLLVNISAASLNQICPASDEILISRFNKLFQTLKGAQWITASSAIALERNINSSLKMIKCIHLWKALLWVKELMIFVLVYLPNYHSLLLIERMFCKILFCHMGMLVRNRDFL